MESRFYLRESCGSVLSRLLQDLPEEIRPTHYSDSEDRVRSGNLVSDQDRFEQFLAKNRLGFFLVGPKCKYNLVLIQNDVDYSHLDVYSTREIADAPTFFDNLLAAVGTCAVFGFTCSESELRHSNFFERRVGESIIETYVGLDLKGHDIAGVFWRTYLANSLLDNRGVDLCALPTCMTSEAYRDLGVILREEVDIHDWSSIRDDLDRYVDSQAAFFSMRRMLAALPETDDPMALMHAMRHYQMPGTTNTTRVNS